MAKNSGSEDKYFEALDFLINVLKKHEQILDKSIQELAALTEYLEYTNALCSKVENVEEKISFVQKEVSKLTDGLSNMPKETLQDSAKEPEPQAQATALSLALVQSGASLVLHCKQWEDFTALAMHAQTLTFSYKENEKTFQVNAIKGKQIIRFAGAFPDFSLILKTWLSRQLNIIEPNIVESFWEHT